MNKQYRDKIAMVTHDIMQDFRQVGAVSDAEMREFEKNCFVSDTRTAQKPSELHEIGIQAPAMA